MSTITINKNRGWRGLAEVAVLTDTKELVTKYIFSFSQEVWNDLIIHHKIVVPDNEYYNVIYFEDIKNKLPRPEQQRSVLIKNFTSTVVEMNRIKKTEWTSETAENWSAINHFRKNRNNHTTSDWNCIGIRVMPEI